MSTATDPRGRQSGAATLVVATLLLLAATLLALYVTQPIAGEMRLAASHMRDQQAFQAAQAAADRGLAHLAETRGTDATALNAEGAAADAPWRLAYCDGEAGVEAVRCADTGAPAFAGTCTAPASPSPSAWLVGCGWSDDRSSLRRIIARATAIDPLPGRVANPLTTPRGVAFSSGNSTVTNYHANLTIWSGEAVTQGSSGNGKTVIRRPTSAPGVLSGDQVAAQVGDGNRVCGASQAPDLLCTTSAGVFGPDVIQSDHSLLRLAADDFITNFLGMSVGEYKSAVADQVIPASEIGTFAADGRVTVIEGAANWGGNANIGTTTAPAIVVVDGDVTISGGPTFVGVLVVRGRLSVSGGLLIRGAVLAAGPVQATGTLNVIFEPDVVALARRQARYGIVPGTWRDF